MNKIFLIGRLTKDPELRYTSSEAAVCSFTLAVDRRFISQSGEREADFIPVVVWNKAAENCAKYLAKGRQTAVEGRLQIRSFEGSDGQRRWATEVVADNVEFLSSGQKQGGQQQAGRSSDLEYGDLGNEITFDDSDVPF
jgi:single-strand binding protein